MDGAIKFIVIVIGVFIAYVLLRLGINFLAGLGPIGVIILVIIVIVMANKQG